jgi:superfamily II DNA/RNA helicase
MPPTVEQYIHRCGRTARAGRSGVGVSLVGENDRKLMKQVAKSATNPVKARIIPPGKFLYLIMYHITHSFLLFY